MEKLQSLAEFLGGKDPAKPEVIEPPLSEVIEPPIQLLSTKFTLRDFSRAVLNSLEYRRSLYRRITLDELPSAVECMLYHYAGGKPIERVEVEDKTQRLEDAPREILEQRLRVLTDLVEHLRMNDEMNAALSEEDGVAHSSVH